LVETHAFPTPAQNAGLSDDEPKIGELLEGTGGARKFRFAARGKGKSDSYRVITFSMELFANGEKVNLSKVERNEVKGILATWPMIGVHLPAQRLGR